MKSTFFQGKSILLISPDFFGYDREISAKLQSLGADVMYFDDRPSNSSITKGLIRINKKLLERKTEKYYAEVSAIIADKFFDIVFLLNPEALPTSFLEMCKSKWANALYLMYMWDSVNNRKHTLEFVPFCDRVFTFEKDDAQKHNFSFEPLFYLDNYASIRRNLPTTQYDLCFLGTLRADRYAIAKDIKNWCDRHQLKSFLYFFIQNRILYYYSSIREKSATAPLREVSFSKLSTSEVTNILASSKVVLDIQHPKQTGLTMRTLETIGAGKKLITTNHLIKEYDFYNSENICVVNRQNPTQNLNLSFFQDAFKPIPESIIENYSIEAWLKHIFSPT